MLPVKYSPSNPPAIANDHQRIDIAFKLGGQNEEHHQDSQQKNEYDGLRRELVVLGLPLVIDDHIFR